MQVPMPNKMHEKVQHLGFVKRSFAMLSGGSGASERKYARSNNGANPQRRK
jgi:hypothetical protein